MQLDSNRNYRNAKIILNSNHKLLHCSIVILSRRIGEFTILANFFKKAPFFYTTKFLEHSICKKTFENLNDLYQNSLNLHLI